MTKGQGLWVALELREILGLKAMRPSRQALDSTAYGETRGGAMPSDDPREGSCYYVRRQPGRLDWGLLHRTLDQQPDEDA